MTITDLSLKDAIAQLKSKEFTAEEYAQALIARIEKYAHLNCFIDFDAQRLLDAVRAINRQDSPLAGVSIGIKDMILTKGIQTTAASKILRGFVPPYSAHVVEQLERAGGVCGGKTNLDEFAMGSSNEHSAFGPVLNPWDTTRVPGGSSGGSAAAVAARLLPAALGTDTGGSVRQPAAFCGVVGMKPTYGRLSRYGVVAFASSLDQVGVFARTVEDCSLLYEQIAGWDKRDATSVQRPVESAFPLGDFSLSGLRVGFPKQYYSDGIEESVRSSIFKTRDALQAAGAEILEVDLPHTEAAIAAYYILNPAEAASNLSRYDGVRYGLSEEKAESLHDLYRKTRSHGFGSEVKRRILVGTYVLSKGYYDAYYRKAQRVRRLILQDFVSAFTKCDVLLTPVTPTTAFPLGAFEADPLTMYLNDVFTVPVNLAGLPGISIPCGLDEKQLPIGLQLIAPAWQEALLLRVAAATEALIDTEFKPLEN
ncbi:MAG: Asp-tRNA(Asn)/Glu-tRNA(Gln) amidotransferase subunit GatA [Bdellovibrionales bacterium]|nr:Asp-tRNA(Asn)/Glu-tRNA(Gln) amidotransferase subunit GatA [Bdellovibrionales bacterium]